jgi:monoamine oxidase
MKKILIIGAGACGLMAAKILVEKGHEVLIVEARGRTGGRIHTMTNGFALPVETGAEFMHGEQPVTRSILKEAALRTTLLAGKRYQMWDGVREKGDLFDDEWGDLTKELEKLEYDTDMHSFMSRHFSDERYAGLRKKVQGFVEGYDAADLHRVSALALRQEWSESDDEHQYHVEGGYSGMIRYLEEFVRKGGGEIHLSSAVREIEWREGKVSVKCAGEQTFEGEKVIVTIPLGVLQRGTVRFLPDLPAHQAAFLSMGFGGVVKFFFEFRTAFWEDRISEPFKDLAFVFSDAQVPTWWTQSPHKTPMLTGWLGGPSALGLPPSNDEAFETAIQSLEYIFRCPKNVILSEIVRQHVVNWLNDQFACGAYAYPTVKTATALNILEKPLKETVYFAGEAMYKGSAIGTVEAALVNGKEVAEMIY